MPLGSGRKKAIEWEQVSEVENNTTKVSCDYCHELISKKKKKIERVRPIKRLQKEKRIFRKGK